MRSNKSAEMQDWRLNQLEIKTENIITEYTTKTVGSDKDFKTLHEALRWCEKATTSGKGSIALSVDDGIHVLGGDGEFDEYQWCYYEISNIELKIKSASGIEENCIITLDGYDDGDNWPYILYAHRANISFAGITFDGALDGYPYHQNVSFVFLKNNSGAVGYTSVFKNVGWVVYGFWNISVNFVRCTCDTTQEAFYVLIDATVQLTEITCNNSNKLVYVGGTSKGLIVLPTLQGGTVLANIPLNEIQYDGGYITDNSGALSFKA